MATKLSEGDCSWIWELHGQGLNVYRIAQRLGRAYSAVATVIKASGGVRPGRVGCRCGRRSRNGKTSLVASQPVWRSR